MTVTHDLSFQILIGTIQTPFCVMMEGQRDRVSNPHRYDPNPEGGRTRRRHPEFQILIGTIQTLSGVVSWYPEHMFQILIGTIQTEPNPNQPRYTYKFQILIGTIQTNYQDMASSLEEAFQILIGTIQTWNHELS